MASHRRLFITAALLLSLCLHAAVFYWFSDIHVGPFAIPAQAHRLFPPLHLKRVEIPAQSLAEAIPAPPPPLPPEEAPPAVLPQAAETLPQSLQAAPPPELPQAEPGTAPVFAPIVPAPPAAASPYALNDHAALEAQISKFAIGPQVPGLPDSLPAAPVQSGSQAALETAASAPAALPSLGEVTARFHLAPPAVQPNLPQPVVLTLPTDILFDFDSAQLRSGADALLRQALAYFLHYGKAEIEIDGYTDSFGAPDYNQNLSVARAEAVRAWFRPQLPEASYVITTKGFGATCPVVDPHGTVEQQQKNRRVEMVVRALVPSAPR